MLKYNVIQLIITVLYTYINMTLATEDLSYDKCRSVTSAENVIQVEMKPTKITY
jgi:hypothetical protein